MTIAKKHAQQYMPNGELSLAQVIQAAIDEATLNTTLRLIAVNREVVELNERIRQLEAERMPEFAFDDEVRWILGRPNFACGGIARDLRRLGNDITTKAEDEQAFVIHWMLTMYRQYGKDWRTKGDAMLAAAPAQENSNG